MPERRKHERSPASFSAQVTCAETHKPIGRLLDISLSGMMIVGKRPLTVNQMVRLRIEMPSDDSVEDFVEVRAKIRWSETDVSPGQFMSGLEFVLKTQDEANNVARLYWAQSAASRSQLNY